MRMRITSSSPRYESWYSVKFESKTFRLTLFGLTHLMLKIGPGN